MEGNNISAQDFSLDLLEESNDDLIMDEINSGKKPNKNEPEKKENTNNPGDSTSSKESVAKDKDGNAPDKKSADDGNSSPSGDMSQIYSSLANHLHESGVLSSLNEDEPIKTSMDLRRAIESEVAKGLTETQRSFDTALKSGMKTDEFVAYQRQIDTLNGITDESIESEDNSQLRNNIIAQDFINKGFSKDEALRHAQRSIELGEDVQDAKNALSNIKAFTNNSFEKRQLNAKLEADKVNEKISTLIDKKNEVIPGIKIDDNTRARLLDQITKPVAKLEDGTPVSRYGKELVENPEEMKVMTEYLFMITDGFKDFTKINSAIETKKTVELDDILKNNTSAFSGGGKVNFDNVDPQSAYLMKDLNIDD